MYKVYLLFATFCLATLSVAGEVDPTKRFTVIGDYVAIEEDPDYAAYVNPLDESKEEVDLSSATVSVSQEVLDDEGQTQTIELASGTFLNGKVVLEGEIQEPTFANITVQTGETTTLSMRTLLVPNKVVSFSLLDHKGQFPPDQMVLTEASRLAKDPSKRFTIAGDLTGINEEHYPMAKVTVRGSQFDEEGNRTFVTFGEVQVKDGSFLIEGEVDEPQIVNIFVTSNMGLYWGGAEAIIEPNAVLAVAISTHWVNRLAITAGTGKHAKIIGKWRMSEEYLAKEAELDEEFNKLRTGTASAQEQEEDSDTEPTEEQVSEEPVVKHDSTPTPAQGCEHVVTQEDTGAQRSEEYSPGGTRPPFITLQDDLREIRNAALLEIALKSEDPIDSLLALELDPFIFSEQEVTDAALPIYDRLMTLLDEDTMARRVKPPRDELARLVARDMNDKALIPGQRAPKFTLTDLNGTDVSLAEVLDANESVFIDFWASWCTPCIEDFPALKDLHASYKDNGFEVLTISVDDTFEDWKEAVDQIEFPWIDLGSLGGIETETPVSYGVFGIPKGFLVDSHGCILQKEIRPDKLKEVLSLRYEDQSNN